MRPQSIMWTDQMRQVVAELQQRPFLRRLLQFAEQCGVELYTVGGTLRDLCLGRPAQDIDLAMVGDVMGFARRFANHLGAAYVPMDAERGEARVVYHKRDVIDFARLRGDTISEDLRRRDFTINAMACPLGTLMAHATPELIDPYGGWHDMRARVIRMVSDATFRDDPLRLLRAFRLAATLNFTIAPATFMVMEPVVSRLLEVAAERIHGELLKLFAARDSTPHVIAMTRLGLLEALFPELAATRGFLDRSGNQGDIFEHSIRTYQQVEDLISAPGSLLPGIAGAVIEYFQTEERQALVKWTGLLHAIGGAMGRHEPPQANVTGHGSSEQCARQWEQIGNRLKLSRRQTDYVSTLILHYSRLLELATLDAQGRLALRSVHGWCKEVGDGMLGTFVLAIGHALAAGQGDASERNAIALGQLAARLWDVYHSRILPVITTPRLVTGHDLQQLFRLTPGPRFKTLLDELEVAQIEGRIRTRTEALRWVAELLKKV
jgi:poly(A) polymerase